MHGCDLESNLLVNAEVDSMGGVVDGGVGVGVKTSPRKAAIEKAQAELRQEYDVREERRRELEFLEKGGNPLDFKSCNAASVSVQSTSLIDQQVEHIVTSEAKGSFALTASPQGDSVESSDRPVVPAVLEPSSADNLLLFAGENELREGERNSKRPSKRSSVVQSEQSSRLGKTQNAKESEDSGFFRPYARRNRSKISRDSARSSSADVIQSRGGHNSSLPARALTNDGKGPISEPKNQKSENVPSFSNTKWATSNGDLRSKMEICNDQLNMEKTGVQGAEIPDPSKVDTVRQTSDIITSKNLESDQHHEPPRVEAHHPSSVLTPEGLTGNEHGVSSEVARKAEVETHSVLLKGSSDSKKEKKSMPNGQDSGAAIAANGINSDSSSTQNSLILDVNNNNNSCFHPNNNGSIGKIVGGIAELQGMGNLAGDQTLNDRNEIKTVEDVIVLADNNESSDMNNAMNDSTVKLVDDQRPEVEKEGTFCPFAVEAQKGDLATSKADGKVTISEVDRKDTIKLFEIPSSKNLSSDTPVLDVSTCESPQTNLPGRKSDSDNLLTLKDKAHDDSILEEARIIEAKRKRITELSATVVPPVYHEKSHWDFVVEEMAWLANDFAQERLWKMTAAAQICRRAAFTSQLRLEERNRVRKLKEVAFTLANAVMQFWCHAEGLLNDNTNIDPEDGRDLTGSCRADVSEASKNNAGKFDMDKSKDFEQQHVKKIAGLAIQGYAVRFLKHNSSPVPALQVVQPAIHERTSDLGFTEPTWDERLTEESLFYAVPFGAIGSYRKSIETYLAQTEKTGGSLQEGVDTSVFHARADFLYHDDAYYEDEEEATAFFLPGDLEGNKSLNLNQKKRRNSLKANVGLDLPDGNCMIGSQQPIFTGKHPTSLNVGSVPTKRVRTGSRLRDLSPFTGAASAGGLLSAKTDASSGDTNSFQDDQSTLNDGSKLQKGLEIQSVGGFEKQLSYDYVETTSRPKKKKKAKHLASAYDQNWQLESNTHIEQRDYSRKRLEGHHIDSNGTNGPNMQYNAKRPKMMRQYDNNFHITPSGSIPSQMASQMSNMENPSKFIKMIGARDKGKKTKTLKVSTFLAILVEYADTMHPDILCKKKTSHPCVGATYNLSFKTRWQIPASQRGPGGQWSLFEDQALVVLVHDMGPNWGLVSDAINRSLQLKCIFRKPSECKERHKVLMDRSVDGTDSTDDSGSSQSYTLPGIPKGSARQLFQRLQGPVEEETLRFHFEKIIMIGRKNHYLRNQNEKVEPKQIVPTHKSHEKACESALSQIYPNNLTGGILMPLDLCDATLSSQDVLPLAFESPHASGLALSGQGAVGSILPASNANSSLQGSSGMVAGGNLPSSPLGGSVRDGRYGVPIMPLPVDEQHRIQQHNQSLVGRNIQLPNVTVPGSMAGVDHGVRVLPGGNSAGVVSGMSRSMPLPRSGFRGVNSTSMLNSGSVHSPSMVGMPSPSSTSMHSGSGSGKGNSMLRPRDAMHVIRPGHNSEHQRQVMVPELPMQVAQGNPSFDGLNSAFTNQTSSPTVQTYRGHSQQQHQISQHPNAMSNAHHSHFQGPIHGMGSSQQAYTIRLAKERQMQQHRLMLQQQQQQQFPATGALMHHVEQPQLAISAPLQSSSQIQSQTSQPPLTPSSPMTPTSVQNQQKHNLPPHGLNRNPQSGVSGLPNQMGKQRQRQLQQQQQSLQTGRQHPQHRQQTQSQQQVKLLKGLGRGNVMVHQNLSGDASHLNGLSISPVNEDVDKGEQIMHLMQGQSLYSGSSMSPVQQSKPFVCSQSSKHSQPQKNLYALSTPPTSKQIQHMPSHSENSSQSQVGVSSGHASSTMRQVIKPAVMSPNHQHLSLQPQPNQKPVNQGQSVVQRMIQQNRQVNSDSPSKTRAEQPQSAQQLANVISQVGTSTTMAMSLDVIDSPIRKPVVSSAVVTAQKSSEPICDTASPNMASQVGSIANSPVADSSVIDPLPLSKGLDQMQASGVFHPDSRSVGAQWQQQPHLQQFSIQTPTSQLPYLSNEQLQEDQNLSPQQKLPLQE